MEHPEERAQFSRRYREYAVSFSADSCAQKLESILLDQARAARPDAP
jgi:hypothetical protein